MQGAESIYGRHLVRKLEAKANAFNKVFILTPQDVRRSQDHDPAQRFVVAGQTLCNVCKLVDFRVAKGESNEEAEYDLGFVHDIIRNHGCSLCRLVTASLHLNWNSFPTYDNHGEKVRCFLFIPGPENGHGRRELVVSALCNATDLLEGLNWLNRRQSIKLLADDLRLTKPVTDRLNSGLALLTSSKCDPGFFDRTFRRCVDQHGIHCEWFKFMSVPEWAARQSLLVRAKSYARSLRVMDLEANCVVTAPLECRFVALSYVWGGTSFLQLRKGNKDMLAQRDALKSAELPRTIRDTMKLVQLLGERYLWIDALCIIQDDSEDKIVQIDQMDVIYSSAVLTIVAASGTDSNAGLPGLESGSRQPEQYVESIVGLRFVALGPELAQIIDTLRYSTRGWTFQELALSRRVLCFTPSQCYYLCGQGVQSEDTILEHADEPNRCSQSAPDAYQLNTRSGLWVCYKSIVNQYSSRDFTHENDVNDGCDGILNALSSFEDESFICGLPETLLEIALLWQPVGPLKRRNKHRSGKEFPTWSWTGWVGPVQYSSHIPSSRDIHSEISQWTIETSGGKHALFVDASYITTNAPNESPQSHSMVTSHRPFTPSPWRSRLKNRSKSTAELLETDELQQSASINPLRSRTQTGSLYFTTRLATFMIYNDYTKHPAGDAIKSKLRPCSILHHTDPSPRRASVTRWVGTIFIEDAYAKELPMLFPAEFIVLSSTNKTMLPLWSTTLVRRPRKGLLFDEHTFTPLPENSADVSHGLREKPLLFNVMWVDWTLEYTSRRGIGQIHRHGWELADEMARSIKLI